MFAKLLEAVRYVVRAVGLVAIIGTAAFVLWAALMSKKPSAASAAVAALSIAAAVLSWPRLPDAWRFDPPTEKQLRYAESLGIMVPQGVSKGQLSDMISAATGR